MLPKTPLRKRTPDRKAREYERTYGGDARREWVRSLPCLVCGSVPSKNAHVPSRSGMSRKGDARWVVPLCGVHHRTGKDSLHELNKDGFHAHHGIDLMHTAEIVDARWEVHLATQPKPETPK